MKIIKRLPSRYESLPEFFAFLNDHLKKQLALDDEVVFNIKLSMEEAVTNAMKHGNKFDPSRIVEITIDAQEDQIIMTVQDEGAGFDHHKVPDPTADERLMKTSGRGVFLIRRLMDEVSYSDNGRMIRMVKKIRKKGG